MFFRTFMIIALMFTVTACAKNKGMDAGDLRVDERQDIMAGPLDGTQVYDRSVLDGPTPGSQQDLVVNVGDRVFFGYDRYDLTPEAQRTLELQAEWMKRYPNVRMTIEGHCDERGTREYNLALGERRANSVKSYMVALGIEPMRVNTISYGKERPAVLGSDPAAWTQNRRGVSIVE
ncbi:MAG: peptidoglycan-associated lipoprotein [Alphaproteobacteria bacterium CG_4_9_14_3_um_filter_47_13]|nr:MAG: peptidoglycan-associated lipoprotein [Alphaproteobacteria bacterium CG_4_9_14_3_um_filter_47_13]